MPAEEFLELAANSRERWEVLCPPELPLPELPGSATSAGAHWRGPRIIMDTGCGDSIVSFQYAKAAGLRLEKVPAKDAKVFVGVGGEQVCRTKATIPLGELQEEASFWVTGQSPALSSVGKRCSEGHSFVWPAGGSPYFITPWGTVVPLVVEDDIPWLHPGSSSCAPQPLKRHHFQVPEPHCGVSVDIGAPAVRD